MESYPILSETFSELKLSVYFRLDRFFIQFY